MIGALFAAAALLAQAAPTGSTAPGQTVSPLVVTPAPPVSKRREVDKAELICTQELPMGSRFPVKVCATRGERQARTLDDQMELRKWTALRPGPGN